MFILAHCISASEIPVLQGKEPHVRAHHHQKQLQFVCLEIKLKVEYPRMKQYQFAHLEVIFRDLAKTWQFRTVFSMFFPFSYEFRNIPVNWHFPKSPRKSHGFPMVFSLLSHDSFNISPAETGTSERLDLHAQQPAVAEKSAKPHG
jgi:hypothetical protein